MTHIRKGYLLLLLGALFLSCNDEDFARNEQAAGEPPKEAPAKKKYAFAAPCEVGDEGDLTYEFDLRGSPSGNIVKLDGAICQKKAEEVKIVPKHILMSIDISGSMDDVDPLTAGSCKRLEAASALLDVVKNRFEDTKNLSFSASYFGSRGQDLFGGIGVEEFEKNYLNAQTFCRFENQATNYEAAFMTIQGQVTAGPEGADNYIFMITDGVPSLDNAGTECQDFQTREVISEVCMEKGAAAAQALREVAPELNVLFLTDPRNEAVSEANRSYLVEKIAGRESRVKFAGDASDAARRIRDFEIPEGPKTEGDIEAQAQWEEGLESPKLELEQTGAGKWSFSTQFELPGEEKTYLLRIKPKLEGKTVNKDITIRIKVTISEDTDESSDGSGDADVKIEEEEEEASAS